MKNEFNSRGPLMSGAAHTRAKAAHNGGAPTLANLQRPTGEARPSRSGTFAKMPHSICYSRNYYAAYSYSWHLSKIALTITLLYNGQVLGCPYTRRCGGDDTRRCAGHMGPAPTPPMS